jgi:hypothetical protein
MKGRAVVAGANADGAAAAHVLPPDPPAIGGAHAILVSRHEGAARTGVLPSSHRPLTKLFPTVSAFDVGAVAAELLLSPARGHVWPRIVHVEGPRRYTPVDVADATSSLFWREIVARELPRTEWDAKLRCGGLSESYIRLVIELCDAHNAGRIDAELGAGEIRRSQTELVDALTRLMPTASG